MNYGDIKYIDVANGPGVRVSIFVSGCSHHCKGCFNEETWDFNFGEAYTSETEDRIMEYLKPNHIRGLSLLGGDPMEPSNMEALVPLLKRVKAELPHKDIWCYTGCLFERDVLGKLMEKYSFTKDFVENIDILVDGPYVEELKNVNLRFRGSENQRIIDVKKSLEKGETVLWDLGTK
ncbi:MAG: anaerobic ribonucleoside-triphosphate reductase activating protein [Lachnospiraceae bacterium]|nr:anaerobic ribonucleoside-triphosphate reductase activating protein [Lachnospiraceae bacterium]